MNQEYLILYNDLIAESNKRIKNQLAEYWEILPFKWYTRNFFYKALYSLKSRAESIFFMFNKKIKFTRK